MAAIWLAPITPPSLKLTALALADWCDDNGGSLYPSMAAIGKRVGVSRSQAQRLMHDLMAAGLVTVEANAFGGKPGATPHYRLHLDRLTGRMYATGSASATGSADAQEGPHGRTGGVAPMRQTGSTGATQTTMNHQLTTKEPSEVARTRARSGRKERIPEAWLPSKELREWAESRRPGIKVDEVAEAFVNYHLSKGEVRANWDASFRTWVLREPDRSQYLSLSGRGGNRQEALEQRNRDVAANWAAGLQPISDVLSPQIVQWHETRAGVEQRAQELGLKPYDGTEQFPIYRARVVAADKQQRAPA